MIYNQLFEYFNDNKLLSEQQYGFKGGHSTELSALMLYDYIISELDKDRIPLNIYLDLSKAFDTLNYYILLSKFRFGIQINSK